MNKQQIGEFQIIERIAEGGMGEVFRAAQAVPQREVALKLVKSLSPEAESRFRREVELTARLDHPNVARLYSAGQTDDGPPITYYAMEFVDGEDLLSFARSQQLKLKQRLTLLIKLCRAVHFAHTHGVIHRDLKPANVLVTDDGEPKILDFGVARAVDEQNLTQVTVEGQVLGTLAYMSPEQLSGHNDQIGPHSDVYALGVIAYELLADQHPYPGLPQDSVITALGRLRDSLPVRLGKAAQGTPRDVETIVMQAIAHEPARRYQSALELAADLERYLQQQPISAYPPSLAYTLKLFVVRHKAISVAGVVATLSMAAAALISIQFAVQESAARQEAEDRAAEYKAISEFTNSLFKAGNNQSADGNNAKVLDLLQAAEQSLEADQEQPSQVRAEVRMVLSLGYDYLGDSERSLTLLTAAERLFRQVYPAGHVRLIDNQKRQAQVLTDLSRISEAAQVLQRAIEEGFPDTSEGDYQRAGIGTMLAVNFVEQGRSDEALAELDFLLGDPRMRATFPVDVGMEANLMYWRSKALEQRGELFAAVEVAEQTLAIALEVFPQNSPAIGFCESNLALLYRRAARFDEAIELSKKSMQGLQAVRGDEHPSTLGKYHSHAVILRDAGKFSEARAYVEKTLPLLERYSGKNTREFVASLGLLADLNSRDSRVDLAQEQFEQALSHAAEVMPKKHPHRLDLQTYFARHLQRHGRHDEAYAQLSTWLANATGHVAAQMQLEMAAIDRQRGDTASANQRLEAAKPVIQKYYAEQHPVHQSLLALLAL